jgi:glycosyltransferase involved in cell wall biosynthesis
VREELGIGDGDFVIGGVGTLGRQKSFDISIRALAIVRRRIPHARLVLVGQGPERTFLEHVAYEEGVADHVTFLGSRDDVYRLMNAFDLFCMPSSDSNETLGIVFLEAMATGVPIVVPDLPGPRRVAGEGRRGLIARRGDCRSFAAAWLRISRDAALCDRLIHAGRQFADSCDRPKVLNWVLGRLNALSDCEIAPVLVEGA